MSTALKVQDPQNQLARAEFFTVEQQEMIRNSFLNGATEAEAKVLLELAKVRKLNPISGQIHFVKRSKREGQGWVSVWAAQVGIDGFRAIAERTGKYEGQDEPEFETDKAGRPTLCRVRVYRRDWSRPIVGVAHFSEYVQKNGDGNPNHMWASKPFLMIAKCAEALALRKAFPDDLGGLYTPDEQPDEIEVTEAPKAAPVASNNRIAEAAKRKVQASPPSFVESSVVPKSTPRKMEIVDMSSPEEPDGYAESLAQEEDSAPAPKRHPSGITAWYTDKKERFEKGQAIEDMGTDGLNALLWILNNGDSDPKYAKLDERRLAAIEAELRNRGEL